MKLYIYFVLFALVASAFARRQEIDIIDARRPGLHVQKETIRGPGGTEQIKLIDRHPAPGVRVREEIIRERPRPGFGRK